MDHFRFSRTVGVRVSINVTTSSATTRDSRAQKKRETDVKPSEVEYFANFSCNLCINTYKKGVGVQSSDVKLKLFKIR